MDDATRLLLAAQNGDRDAFERFVAGTQADVWRLCRYLGDLRDADDLTQETYLRAVSSLHRYRADGPARGWLFTIARRVCADHVRRQQRRRRRDVRARAEAVTSHRDHVGNGDEAGRIDIESIVSTLDPDRRAAFVMTQILGLSYAETAESLGCPIGTVRSRVARARVDLVAATNPESTSNATGTDDPRGST